MDIALVRTEWILFDQIYGSTYQASTIFFSTVKSSGAFRGVAAPAFSSSVAVHFPAMPTPMRAPTRQCEVDTGSPMAVDIKTASVAPYTGHTRSQLREWTSMYSGILGTNRLDTERSCLRELRNFVPDGCDGS